jgi:F0F1-type ATP synthase membrane subunit c/vacuolar-type H+-ATPase subunit K
MELEAAKMIGAGLAAIALAGAGVGIGIIFGNYLVWCNEKSICSSKTISKPAY